MQTPLLEDLHMVGDKSMIHITQAIQAARGQMTLEYQRGIEIALEIVNLGTGMNLFPLFNL